MGSCFLTRDRTWALCRFLTAESPGKSQNVNFKVSFSVTCRCPDMSATMTNARVIQATDVTQPTVRGGTAAGMARGVPSPVELNTRERNTIVKGCVTQLQAELGLGSKTFMKPAVPSPAKGPKL